MDRILSGWMWGSPGSVLSPALFVVYITDLPDVVDAGSNIYMFAHDT